MKIRYSYLPPRIQVVRQRGVILFVALIALVTIMLAALALVRMVDTSTVVAGNLAFKQAATMSGDGGMELAIKWITKTDADNLGVDQWAITTHPFNNDDAANGYYSNLDPALDMTAKATWGTTKSAAGITDAASNATRYIIQRMCRTKNQVLTDGNCIYSDAATDTDAHNVTNSTQAGAIKGGKNPMYRITVQVTGPRNTVSYIQGFTY